MRSEAASLPEVVVLTRKTEDNAGLAAELLGRGLAVIELPCVRTERLGDERALREVIGSLGPADLLVLTSRAGAEAVTALGVPVRCAVAVIGPATATAAERAGIRVTFIASHADSATLARELPLPSGEIVLARSDLADAELPAALRGRGARVRDVVAYRTISEVNGDIEAARASIANGAAVVVASPSALAALHGALGEATLRAATFVAIGPTTARAVREIAGVEPLVAAGADARAIADAIAHAPQEVRT